jgi:hypothetical protein
MSDERMDPKVKAEWLTALRSGDYVQGVGALRYVSHAIGKKPKHCCLGVLEDICPLRKWVHNDFTTDLDGVSNLEGGVLSPTVRNWSGIGSRTGHILLGTDSEGSNVNEGLTDLNDSGLFTFDMIADIIEYAL